MHICFQSISGFLYAFRAYIASLHHSLCGYLYVLRACLQILFVMNIQHMPIEHFWGCLNALRAYISAYMLPEHTQNTLHTREAHALCPTDINKIPSGYKWTSQCFKSIYECIYASKAYLDYLQHIITCLQSISGFLYAFRAYIGCLHHSTAYFHYVVISML